jgi:hypothetical protein
MEDEDVGLEPLVMALALSETVVCDGSRGESGVGNKLRSAWGCDAADGAEAGTNISAGGGARVRRSAEWVCREVFSIRALEPILGLELRADCDVRGLELGAGNSAAWGTDGSVVLLEVDARGLVEVRVIDCGLLLRSVWDRAAGLASISATGTGSVALRLLLVVRRRLCLLSSLD